MLRETYSDNFIFDRFMVITGSSSVVNFPTGTAKMYRLKAGERNGGEFLIGDYISNVASYPLGAGDDTGWIPGNSTFRLEHLVHSDVSGTMDYLHVWLKA